MRRDSELTVITRAKELCEYILTVTDKSPKKFRFTLVSRMQNYSLSIIEELYRANDVYIGKEKNAEQIKKRLAFQKEAMTTLRLLGYMASIAREAQCVLPKQQAQISDKIVETQCLLYAWMKSDAKR